MTVESVGQWLRSGGRIWLERQLFGVDVTLVIQLRPWSIRLSPLGRLLAFDLGCIFIRSASVLHSIRLKIFVGRCFLTVRWQLVSARLAAIKRHSFDWLLFPRIEPVCAKTKRETPMWLHPKSERKRKKAPSSLRSSAASDRGRRFQIEKRRWTRAPGGLDPMTHLDDIICIMGHQVRTF